MKRFVLALAVSAGVSVAAHAVSVEPPHWWIGMANDTLQLLINGPGIASADVSVDYSGVKVVRDVDGVSPNYKIIYMTISSETHPGQAPLRFTYPGGQTVGIDYPLLARDSGRVKARGFDAGDVLYLIMPDRFADGDTANNNTPLKYPYTTDRAVGHARHGGDIAGIRRHLDYIDSLGVTAIWVNPVLANDVPDGAYHGYATTDYYAIDARLGTNAEWDALVAEAHDRGIKVVMDMIFNHTGHTHPWMADKPMADWYNHPDGDVMTNFRLSTIHDPYVSDIDRDATVNGWFVIGMPDLNQRNPHLMKYLTQNSIYWIEQSGIDGIRMDTYPYADERAMARWIADVEREYPDFNIVGECWYGTEGGEAYWQRGSYVNPVNPNLKTVMDFKLSIDAPKAFAEETGPYGGGFNTIYDHLSLDYLFPDPQHILTFLDNHDTDRFLRDDPDDLATWKQAQTLLLTSRGIPQIYYGTEILMSGTREHGGDGNVRRDMPGGFPGDTVTVFDGSGMTPLQREAYDFMRTLLQWRRQPAVRNLMAKGSLKHFMPHTGAYVYARTLGDDRVIVIMNGRDTDLNLDMKRYAEIVNVGDSFNELLTDSDFTVPAKLMLRPRQIIILTSGSAVRQNIKH